MLQVNTDLQYDNRKRMQANFYKENKRLRNFMGVCID